MNTDLIRILLVEDSPTDADLLRQTLSQASAGRFEFTWVERLEDALARLIEQSFDVLLLDLSLPDSSGPETYRRAHNAAPRLPIVVLTGADDESVGLAAVQEGVQDYLVKGKPTGGRLRGPFVTPSSASRPRSNCWSSASGCASRSGASATRW